MKHGGDWLHVCHSAVGSSPKELARLEERIRAKPDDLDTHVRLVGAYWLKATKTAFRRRARHLLWIATHHPAVNLGGYAHLPSSEVPKEYGRVREAWLGAVARHRADDDIANAAASFVAFEDPGRALGIYLDVAKRSPSTSAREQVGRTFMRMTNQAGTAQSRRKHARAAIEWFRTSLEDATEPWHVAMLRLDIARAAVVSRDWVVAVEAARRALAKKNASAGTWVYGNIVHDANVTLGLASLAGGDLRVAARRLRAAGKSPGSPQLNSFGPDMALADELTRRAPEDVIAYLRGVRRFWSGREEAIDAWIDAIARGRKPRLPRRWARQKLVPQTKR